MDSAAKAQYGKFQTPGNQPHTNTTSQTSTSHNYSSTLPFTGANLPIILIIALMVISIGVVLRFKSKA